MVLYNYHGKMLKREFTPLGESYQGGFSVAIGNTDGGTHSEAIIGTGPGVPTKILVYNYRLWTLRYSFHPFGPRDYGGVNVAAGNLDDHYYDEIIAVPRNKSTISVFNRYKEKLTSFDISGVFGAGDFTLGTVDADYDGRDEIVVMSD